MNLTLTSQQVKLIADVLLRDIECSMANIAADEGTVVERRRVALAKGILDQATRAVDVQGLPMAGVMEAANLLGVEPAEVLAGVEGPAPDVHIEGRPLWDRAALKQAQ